MTAKSRTARVFLCVCALFVLLLFTISTSALPFRSGSMPDDNNNPAESTVGDTTFTDATNEFANEFENGFADGTTDLPSETSAPGTGEFFDDGTGSIAEKPPADAPNAPSDETAGEDGKVESALDNVITDAEGAVSDVVNGAEDMLSGNGRMWGIVLVIIVIAAAVLLIVAMSSRKK